MLQARAMTNLREYYLDWPHEISIETFAKCNAACTFCPYPTLDRIGEKLPDDILDRIIEELKDHPWPFMLSPFKVNEPLLDKRLIPFCRKVMAELPKAHLRIFTNGSALTQRHIDEIAQLERVTHLWISLNDHRPDEHKALMSQKLEPKIANLDMLHAAVCAGAFPHEVVISRVRPLLEIGEDDKAFSAFIHERWPRFLVSLIKPDGWLGDIPLGSDEIPDAGCGRWFELSITATGVVSLCCMDGQAQFPIGDVKEESLFEIYNKPSYRERRVKNLSRRGIHPCSTCSY